MRVVAAILFLGAVLSASAGPSPVDWGHLSFYQVVTDRFADGDRANQHAHPGARVNPRAADAIHGGDFKGLEQYLDYIAMLGADVVWISPVLMNLDGAYHGYYTTDFHRVDPHWGTVEELRQMVDAAHERGLRVVIDVVLNHMARLLSSDEPGYPAFREKPYSLRWKDDARRFAPPFDRLDWFHGQGSISDWSDPVQYIRGDLRGLADLKTDEPAVREALVRAYAELIEVSDCDGFRVDAAGHMAREDWAALLPALREQAARRGKPGFLLLPELLQQDDRSVAAFMGSDLFRTALYYPMQFTLEAVFVRGAPPARIVDRLRNRVVYPEASRERLVGFVDNHDRGRILRPGQLDGDTERLKTALAYLYTGPQAPCLYYGTEQGFNGGPGHEAREDMFDGLFESGPSLGDNFDMCAPLYRFVRRLNLLRKTYPALARGTFTDLRHDTDGPGLLVYAMTWMDQEVVVALNTAPEPRELAHPVRTNLVDLLEGRARPLDAPRLPEKRRVGPPRPTSWLLPAHGASIFIPEDEIKPLPPSVVACVPAHDAYGVPPLAPVTLAFDREMDRASVEVALQFEPPMEGAVTWGTDGRQLVFAPAEPWPESVRVVLDGAARPATGPPLGARFVSTFHTVARASDAPLGCFVMDGRLDSGVPMVAERDGTPLYASWEPASGVLYVATWPAGDGLDRFILLDDELSVGGRIRPPWGKKGWVPSDGPYLAGENDNAFVAWRRATGETDAAAGEVMEGVINLRQQYGKVPGDVFLVVLSYETADGGAVVPEREGDDVTSGEFFRLNLNSYSP